MITRRTFAAAALTPSAARASVALAGDGMLVIDGKRTFLLGLYHLPNRLDSWKLAAQAGFHVVHCKPEKSALDEAHRAGLRAWVTTGSEPARITKTAGALKDHPALLFWETEDEPSFTWKKPKQFRVAPRTIQNAYRLIRKLDPEHPVYLNHAPTNLVSTLRLFDPGGDLIATDIYPVMPHGLRSQYALWPDGQQGDLLNTTISQAGQYVDKMRQVAGPSRGLWMVLQAFAWEMLRKEGDRDPKMVVYPDLGQLRFMAFQAIVHGVTGLLWWGLKSTPGNVRLWDDLSTLARELTQHAAELASAPTKLSLEIEYHDTGHSLDRGLEWTARPTADGLLLIVVNADKNPVEATLRGGSRVIREEFEPFGVRLYRLRG